MNVHFFQRKPGKTHFSIEALFKNIIENLPADVRPTVVESSYVNSGIYQKLYNITEILFKKQGDINHVTGDIHYITLFLKKQKTVLTVHDINLLYSSSTLKRLIHTWFWLRIPISRSRVVTVISHTTKQEILKHSKCSPDKIQVIHNCISSRFRPVPKSFNKEKPVILQIGSKPNKNLTGLAEALKGIPCKLEIVGKPTTEEIAVLQRNQIDYRTQFGLSEEEILQKYIDCDIVAFVSFYEGFGLPIVEANTVERAVVTSNLSAMPEIAADAACLVNPHDPASIRQGLLRVINDDDYREELIRNGRKNRERFTAPAIAEQYYQLYRTLLKKPGPPSLAEATASPVEGVRQYSTP